MRSIFLFTVGVSLGMIVSARVKVRHGPEAHPCRVTVTSVPDRVVVHTDSPLTVAAGQFAVLYDGDEWSELLRSLATVLFIFTVDDEDDSDFLQEPIEIREQRTQQNANRLVS